MALFRTFLYSFLLVGTLVALHYTDVPEYRPVKEHKLYKDFVGSNIEILSDYSQPLVKEVMRIPQVAELFGLNPNDSFGGYAKHQAKKVQFSDAGSVQTPGGVRSKSGSQGSPNQNASNDADFAYQGEEEPSYADGEEAPRNLKFTNPSQMQFSLAELGMDIQKRSILSTEGEASNYFEIPDGSRLWLAEDSVVEAGWQAGMADEVPVVLLRVEKGVMHVQRRGGAMGKLYIVTNSGIRYPVAASDGWMAAAYSGVLDKESNPDVFQIAKDRSTDYARRATLSEARKLSGVIESDLRREGMLAQDQIRKVAEQEEVKKNQAVAREKLLPVEVLSIPLEIGARRDLSNTPMGRAPASVGEEEFDNFPARRVRGPASVGSAFDETAQVSSEAQVLRYLDQGQCGEALHVFKKTVERYSLRQNNSWRQKIAASFEGRCSF